MSRPSMGSAPKSEIYHLAFRIAPLIALELVLWAGLIGLSGLFRDGPNGKSLGVDFGVFVSAAQVLRNGGNPYNNDQLYRTEISFFARQHLPVTHHKRLVRVGNPPLFYWLLEPLTGHSFQMVAAFWIAGLLGLAALGFLAALSFFGWTYWTVPLIAFIFMPQIALGAAYGNVQSIVFASLALMLALIRRFPVAAGMVLTISWLKPQLVFPLALIVLLSFPNKRNRTISGFVCGTAVLIALVALTTGLESISLWLRGLIDWSGDIGLEPNLASLAGLYVSWATAAVRTAFQIGFVAAATAITAVWWWPRRNRANIPILEGAWLWFVWFLATPYAHFPDEILLSIPILALLGSNGSELARSRGIVVVYAMFFDLALFSGFGKVNALSLVLIPIAVRFYGAARDWT